MTSRVFLFILLFILTFVGVAQETLNENSHIKSQDSISFILDTEFTIKGILTNSKFNYDKYIEVLGKPDKDLRGGSEVIAEFGCDDFMLTFSKNRIWAGGCYLSDAFIEEVGIDINGLEIGDTREKVEKTFEIDTKNKSEVWIRGNSVLILYFDSSNRIKKMHFSQPIT